MLRRHQPHLLSCTRLHGRPAKHILLSVCKPQVYRPPFAERVYTLPHGLQLMYSLPSVYTQKSPAQRHLLQTLSPARPIPWPPTKRMPAVCFLSPSYSSILSELFSASSKKQKGITDSQLSESVIPFLYLLFFFLTERIEKSLQLYACVRACVRAKKCTPFCSSCQVFYGFKISISSKIIKVNKRSLTYLQKIM